jgi:hypothetical protein
MLSPEAVEDALRQHGLFKERVIKRDASGNIAIDIFDTLGVFALIPAAAKSVGPDQGADRDYCNRDDRRFVRAQRGVVGVDCSFAHARRQPDDRRPRTLIVTASALGMDSRRLRNAVRSSHHSRRRMCRSASRLARQRTRSLQAFLARLHTADHQQFTPSKDRCSAPQLPARAGHLRCRQIRDSHRAGARGRFRRRPRACQHTG